MLKGNQCYSWLSNQQINYSAPEILAHPQLGFAGVAKCGSEYQFTNFASFAAEMEFLISEPNHTKLAVVLILPPDKSMLLVVGKSGESVLLESHSHLGAGAIVAAASSGSLTGMASYIEFMAKRDWSPNITPFDVTLTILC